jgi:hypothetical protein
MDVLSTLSSSRTRIIELEFKGHFSHDGELVERGEVVSTFEELVHFNIFIQNDISKINTWEPKKN